MNDPTQGMQDAAHRNFREALGLYADLCGMCRTDRSVASTFDRIVNTFLLTPTDDPIAFYQQTEKFWRRLASMSVQCIVHDTHT